MIPDGKAYKITWKISHAPLYVREFDCGAYNGTFAAVENISRDLEVSFTLDPEEVEQWLSGSTANITELDIDSTPFRAGAHHIERHISTDRALKIDFGPTIQYLIQLQNNQFIVWVEDDFLSPSWRKIEEILNGERDLPITEVPRDETPILESE